MGKHKQQVISRFFAPQPKSDPNTISNPNPNPNPNPNHPPPSISSPAKIATTISFSPSKRKILSQNSQSPLSKKPKTLIPSLPDPSLHQKFLQKLLEPSPPKNADTPPLKNLKYTPLEQQVVELKSKYPNVLLMIEVGYKYRFFDKDAEIAARVLGIFAHLDHNFLTASIPSFRLDFHVRRLVTAGYKVGVVKQTETAAIKAHGDNKIGPFTRDLSALYTKATLEAAVELAGKEEAGGGNYLVCVVEMGVQAAKGGKSSLEINADTKVGLIGVEISTGEVMFGEFDDGVMRPGLEAVILSLSPVEILMGEPISTQTEKLLLAYAGPSSNVRVERTSRDCFEGGGALAEVLSLYENNISEDSSILEHSKHNPETTKEEKHLLGIEGIMAMPDLVVQALALTIRYLKQFGFERILCLCASYRPFSSSNEMSLSANTLEQLEILRNNSDGSENGSLLQAMNHTLTAFGSRLLRHWVSHPLCDRNLISARLDAVSEIAKSMGINKSSHTLVSFDEASYRQPEVVHFLSTVLTTLGRSPDVQRGITRIFHQTAAAAEFIAVIHAILSAGKKLQQLYLEKDESKNEQFLETIVKSSLLRKQILTASSSSMISHAAKMLSLLNKEAADKGDLQNLFISSDDQFPEVFNAHTAVRLAEEKLDLLIDIFRRQLRLHNLEFVSVSGSTHLIELASDIKVPSNWVKVSSTKKAVRYHPPEVLKALDGLLLAKEELMVACRSNWDQFLSGFCNYYAEFQAAVQALAALDCLHSLAILSRNQDYIRPFFVDDSEPGQIHISSGRHPVLEAILRDNFVPNDTNLHGDGECCQIIMGPNMGGKSCYIRQVALIAIMAQVGCFVPASSAKLHVLDAVYTRMGSADSIQQGRSTFLEELSEASHILHKCTSHSLVIIDELGRGTSTHDGVAIAYATLHHLLKEKKCMVLFVTHYPKIMDIMEEYPNLVGPYHVSFLTCPKNMSLTEKEYDSVIKDLDRPLEDVTFLYKVVPGISDRSFGLNVARLAQLPSSCIARAAVMAGKMEAEIRHRVENRLNQKQFQEKLVYHGEILAKSNWSSPNNISNGEQFGGCLDDYEEMKKAFHQFLLRLRTAFVYINPSNSLCSLKDTKKFAIRMLNSERLLSP